MYKEEPELYKDARHQRSRGGFLYTFSPALYIRTVQLYTCLKFLYIRSAGECGEKVGLYMDQKKLYRFSAAECPGGLECTDFPDLYT